MYQIKAKRKGNDIIIEAESFEMVLSALDNQKYIVENPIVPGEKLHMGEENYKNIQERMQAHIDGVKEQCLKVLHNK